MKIPRSPTNNSITNLANSMVDQKEILIIPRPAMKPDIMYKCEKDCTLNEFVAGQRQRRENKLR